MVTRKLLPRRPAQAVAPIVEEAVKPVLREEPIQVTRKIDYKKIIQEYTEKAGDSRTRGIRAFCVVCCNGQVAEVRRCPTVSCPLHGFRMGRKPSAQLKFDAKDMANDDDDVQPEVAEEPDGEEDGTSAD